MSMTPRDNLLSLYRRTGFEYAPVHFNLCPALEKTFRKKYPGQGEYAEVDPILWTKDKVV